MVTTIGRPEAPYFAPPWEVGAMAQYESMFHEEISAAQEEAAPLVPRVRTRSAASTAIREATGLHVDVPERQGAIPDYTDDPAVYVGLRREYEGDLTAPDVESPPKATRRTFSARLGLSPRRRSRPPSQTTEGRRKRYVRSRALVLGISEREAEMVTQHRPATRRAAKLGQS